ncbi:MAG: hypothetical protein PHI71_12265 [Acidiphilium sp.]|nr:hypothetical protein [Acidiphilium sp.]
MKCGAGKDKLKDKKYFFFRKKKQKIFICWGDAFENARGSGEESFLLLFFKKEALP